MSGIINVRMKDAQKIFGVETTVAIRKNCIRAEAHVPSPELQSILQPLRDAFEAGGVSGLLDQVELFIGDDSRDRMAKKTTSLLRSRVLDVIRYLIKRPPTEDMSEGELVPCWEYVINGLSGHNLQLRTRHMSRDCKWRSRINQSMMLFLHEDIGMPLEGLEVLGLDVHGLIGVLFSVKYFEKVFISGLASEYALRLPNSQPTWKKFLEGTTIALLISYVRYIESYRDRVLEQEVDYIDQIKISGKPAQCQLHLSEFTSFSPSKSKDGVKGNPQRPTPRPAKRRLEDLEDEESELVDANV
ncbi:hypothetical protein BGZ46_005250 [Entomortierella lignicola]|nr:hypothetical protein BGZ46_005250 [Entomortierella lignicola]